MKTLRPGSPTRGWMGTLVFAALLASGSAHANTFIVNSTGDANDQNPGNGTCATMPPGPVCTLRAAIQEANALPGPDIIEFNIGGGGLVTIAPAAQLPSVNETVSIDGTTQPGFAGTPLIELDGTGITTAGVLRLFGAASSGSTIRGLIINRSTRAAINILIDSTNNTIVGNFLGTDAAGALAQGTTIGVYIEGSNNQVGGTTTADRNIISGNTVDGIQIYGVGATGNVVQGNYIGLDVTGTVARGNSSQGVAIFGGASSNIIGGTAPGAGNVISGNQNDGILIAQSGSNGNVVQGNRIGTDGAGTSALGNLRGIEISASASGNTIGGTAAGAGNVVSGNSLTGVEIIQVGTSGNNILGNIIGLSSGSTASVANGQFGVVIAQGATSNIVGNAGGSNVISGNVLAGVRIVDAGTNSNLIQSNTIGLDATGTVARGNGSDGVVLDAGGAASGNVVGGVGLGNVISGNGGVGVRIFNGMTATRVTANIIGRDATNSASVPNAAGGIRIQGSSGNTIGGTGPSEGNVIAGNGGGDGVAVVGAATGNAVLRNSIFSNAGLGIDLLDDGVTTNDVGDGDVGSNNLQNYPVLSAAATNGAGSAHIAGSMDGAASTLFRVELFASAAPDPTGFGEGRRYLGFANVVTDASGHAVLGFSLATSLAPGEFVTATATDPSNNTSEFSKAIVAVDSLVVTTTADTVDGNTTSVSTLIAAPGTDGRISLREAILATNATPGVDAIPFGIPLTDTNHLYYRDDTSTGSLSLVAPTTLADAVITDFDLDYPPGLARSWYRIQPTSVFPNVTDAVNVDGSTQPGYVIGGPVIEIEGSLAGASDGLTLNLGPSSVKGLVIGGFGLEGLTLWNGGGYTVTGNYIGVDPSGTKLASNAQQGIIVAAHTGGVITIGGSTPAERNIISGNLQHGILLYAFANPGISAPVHIQGNYIGTDVTGAIGLGTQPRGITLEYTGGHLIGGSGPGEGNLVSGNAGFGIELNGNAGGFGGPSNNNVIEGNRIGTNASGTAPVPNADSGILLFGVVATSAANSNIIRGNVVAAATSGGDGIRLIGNTDGNFIDGNFIGTDAGGTVDLGNTGNGVQIETSGSFLPTGNTIRNNLIRFNDVDGVRILGTGASATLTENQISSNDALGIDLNGDGTTGNDPLDADGGPNELLNRPVLTSAVAIGGSVSVDFQLDVPTGWYRVELFKNPGGADPSGAGEGEVFASWVNVYHPGGGSRSFNDTLAGAFGDVLTATATFCATASPAPSSPAPQSSATRSRRWAESPSPRAQTRRSPSVLPPLRW